MVIRKLMKFNYTIDQKYPLETESEVSAVNQVLQECNCGKGQQCTLNLERIWVKRVSDDPHYLVHQPIAHFLAIYPFVKPKILSTILYHCKDTCNNCGTPLHLTINPEVTAMLLTHPHINVYDQNEEGLTALDRARQIAGQESLLRLCDDPRPELSPMMCIERIIRVSMIGERILKLDNLHGQITTTLLDVQNIPTELANLVASFVTGKPNSVASSKSSSSSSPPVTRSSSRKRTRSGRWDALLPTSKKLCSGT